MTDFMMASGNRSFAEPPDVAHPARPRGLRVERLRPLRGAHRAGSGRRHWRRSPRSSRCSAAGGRRRGTTPSGAGQRDPRERVAKVDREGTEDGRRAARDAAACASSAGQEFDLGSAQKGLDAVWASNLFSSAWLELAARGGQGARGEGGACGSGPTLRAGIGVSYDEADNARGVLRLRNGNLLGLGERLDARFVVGLGPCRVRRFHGQRQPGGFPLRVPAGSARSRGQTHGLRRGGSELGRTRFRQFRLAAAGQRAIGRDGLLEVGLVAGRSEVEERAGIPLRRNDRHGGQGYGPVRLSTPSTIASGPRAGVRVDGRGEQSLTALGASLVVLAHVLESRRLRAAWATRVSSRPRLRRRGPARHVPVYDLFRVGGPDPRARTKPRRDVGDLGRGRVTGSGRAALAAWRIDLAGGAGNAWAERDQIRPRQRSGSEATSGSRRSTGGGSHPVDLGFGAGELKVYVSLGFQ